MHRHHFFDFIRSRLGLIILCVILVAITASIIKPEFYLMGWDNFSSYLNLKNNILTTLFGTWRQHRGLGVPSDAEINDIIRQVFSFVGSLFVGKRLVDQIYMACMLWGGVLGMYVLGREISLRLKQNASQQELFGFISAFFYLFNLSTLAVFYFPMIMYNTRFFMLPTSILILIRIIDTSHLSKRAYIFYMSILFVGMGSFMVPTIFIVFAMMLVLMGLFFKKTVRLFFILIFFVLLNFFWILPFANYTIQKSSVVPEAPTFIEINEAMLNKPQSYFLFERQAKLRPSFFGSEFRNNANAKMEPFHPISGLDESGWMKWAFWIFPATYLLGIAYALLLKRNRLLSLFALTALTFLILSMKEYSPFGLLYGYISDHVPFANTVFRFGDTKFHAMIAFGGAIVAAALIVQIMHSLSRFIKVKLVKYAIYFILVSGLIANVLPFRSYFNGNFIGFFMYNKLPEAYWNIASVINTDPDPVRVIHLPMDNYGYWKPYSWGYFGSSFLHFMLNKPLFDRTFEPASQEGANIHRLILNILSMTSSIPTDEKIDNRALDLYNTFKSLSIKYVIDDQTISTNIDSRDIAYWGTINSGESHRILAYLEHNGYLKLIKQYSVSSKDDSKDYGKLYPYNTKRLSYLYPPRTIYLYEVTNIAPQMQFLPRVEKVHTAVNLLLSPQITRTTGHFVQSPQYDAQSLIYPFSKINTKKVVENNQVQISYPINLDPGSYLFNTNKGDGARSSRMLNIYAQKLDKSIVIIASEQTTPQVNGIQTSSSISSVTLSFDRDDFQYVKIEDSILPITNIGNRSEFIGTVLTHTNSVPVSLLFLQSSSDLSANLNQQEQNPQCLNDAQNDAKSNITINNRTLVIEGQNVSTCLTTNIPATFPKKSLRPVIHTQLELESRGIHHDLPQTEKYIDTGKPKLTQQLASLNNPIMLYVCIKSREADSCLNKDTLFQITSEKRKISVSVSGNINPFDNSTVTLAIKNNTKQKYEATFENITFKTFSEGTPENLLFWNYSNQAHSYQITNIAQLKLVIPIADSKFSQNINSSNGGVFRSDEQCAESGKYQLIKENNNKVISYVVGCRNFEQKNIPFSSDNFYLWLATYKHLSGSFPSIILMDKFNTYYIQKLLPSDVPANDYFSVPLQRPETIFSNNNSFIDVINKTPALMVSAFIEPKYDLEDNKNKEFIIQHNSENEGLIELKDVSLIELPNYWINSYIQPSNYRAIQFTTPNPPSFKRILPSLWEVKTNTSTGGKSSFLFNEQYDKQWIVVGVKTLSHDRCDGYANCYLLDIPKDNSTFYLFYYPELFSWIGFAVTLLVGIIGYKILFT